QLPLGEVRMAQRGAAARADGRPVHPTRRTRVARQVHGERREGDAPRRRGPLERVLVEGRRVPQPDAAVRYLELEPRRPVAKNDLAVGHDLAHLELEPNAELRPGQLHRAAARDGTTHRVRLPGGEIPGVREGAKNAPGTRGQGLKKFNRLHEIWPG